MSSCFVLVEGLSQDVSNDHEPTGDILLLSGWGANSSWLSPSIWPGRKELTHTYLCTLRT